MKTRVSTAASVLALSMALGCGSPSGGGAAGASSASSSPTASGATLAGAVNIDGSSTVYPIAAGLAEEFSGKNPNVRVTVNQAGTGAGLQKFSRKEIDIADASRPIKPSEVEECKKAGVDFVELPIAYDGLCVVVNNSNTWLKSVTVAQLHQLWDKDSKVKSWKDLDPSFPDKPVKLYGPTSAHGTYEFFNDAINKDGKNSRQDYQQCPEYNTLVAGVSRDEGALGYVGLSYYEQNKDKVRVIPVDGGNGPVTPSEQAVREGSYTPLSRPLLMYVNKAALAKPEIASFVDFAVNQGSAAVKAAQYIELPDAVAKLVSARLKSQTAGSAFQNFKPGMKMEDVLKLEGSK